MKVEYQSKDKEGLDQLARVVKSRGANLFYHTSWHSLEEVHPVALAYALESNVSYSERIGLEIAAMGHDYIYVPGREGENETESAKRIGGLARLFGFEQGVVTLASDLILATTPQRKANNLLEGIIQDADLDNLGRPDCLERGQLYRKELEMIGKNFTDRGWLAFTFNLLRSHQYNTPFANRLRATGKLQNMQRILKLIADMPE